MMISFSGLKNSQSKTGCSSCGNKRVTKYNFQREKDYVLPSGMRKTFRIGEVYELNDNDANFLLNQYNDVNGKSEVIFKKV